MTGYVPFAVASPLRGSAGVVVGQVALLSLGPTVVKLLAVAGGALMGALLVGLLVRLLVTLLPFGKAPRPAVVALRLLGAAAGALAVWLWVFGTGGAGWGLGGGGSLFGEGGKGKGSGPESVLTPTTRKNETTGKVPTPTQGEALQVTMLGGDRVKDERFYLVPGKKEPLNFKELKEYINQERQQAGVRTVDILIYEDSVARGHEAVTKLEKWADEQDLRPRFPRTQGDIP